MNQSPLVERTATPTTRLQTAQSYIPNSVSATASTAADRVRDGFDSIATQQRRDQVGISIPYQTTISLIGRGFHMESIGTQADIRRSCQGLGKLLLVRRN